MCKCADDFNILMSKYADGLNLHICTFTHLHINY